MTSSSKKSERKAPYRQERKPARKPSPAPQKTETADDDDFDYDKYLSGIDRKQDPNESEIDEYLKRIRTLTASRRSQFVQIVFIRAKIKCPSRTL